MAFQPCLKDGQKPGAHGAERPDLSKWRWRVWGQGRFRGHPVAGDSDLSKVLMEASSHQRRQAEVGHDLPGWVGATAGVHKVS